MVQRKLENAQIFTLYSGVILGMFGFFKGSMLEYGDPTKQNYVWLIGFGELLVIFSCISILNNKKK